MGILQSTASELQQRFPSDRFTIFEIPYLVLDEHTGKIHVLRKKEFRNLSPRHAANVKTAIVITKKFNWSLKNDLIRKSQAYSQTTYKWETSDDLYTKNILKELLVYIIDDGEELYVDNEVLKGLSHHFVSGFMHYFYNHKHFDTMAGEEEDQLRLHIHKFYSYWRKINSPRMEDRNRVAGEDPPICPSIILETGLADRFGWTLEYIRNLSERDVRAIQVLQSQKEVAEFEGSDEAKKFGDPRKKGTSITRNLSYNEAVKMFQEDNEKKKQKDEEKKAAKETVKETEKKPSQAQLRAAQLGKNNSKIKKE